MSGPATAAVSWNLRALPQAVSSDSSVPSRCSQLPAATGDPSAPVTVSGAPQPGGRGPGTGSSGSLSCHRNMTDALMRLAAFSAPAGISLLHATVADPDERIRRRRVDTGAEPVGRVVRKGRL
jgi:hypothetical protein